MAEIPNHYENYPQILGGHTSQYHMPQNYSKGIISYIIYKILTAYGALLASINRQSAIKIKMKWLVNHTPLSVVIGFFQPLLISKVINFHMSLDITFHMDFANVLFKTGNNHQAKMVVRKLCIRHPKSIAVWLLRAELAWLNCDTNEMEIALNGDKNHDGLHSMIDVNDVTDRKNSAIQSFVLALEARIRLNKHDFLNAKNLAKRALKRCNDHYYALMVMGMQCNISGKAEEAVSCFQRAYKHPFAINRECDQGIEKKSILQCYAFRHEFVAKHLDEFLAEFPLSNKLDMLHSFTQFTPYHFQHDPLFYNKWLNDDRDGAIEHLIKILSESETIETETYRLSQSNVNEDDLSKRLLKRSHAYKQLTGIQQYMVKGQYYFNHYKFRQARNRFKSAQKLYIKPNTYLVQKIAELSYLSRDYKSAKASIDKVLKDKPQNIEAIILAAVIYERLELFDVSAEMWLRAIKQRCNNEEMRESEGNKLKDYITYKYLLMDRICQLSKLKKFYIKKLGREFPEKLFKEAIDQMILAMEFFHDHIFQLPRIPFKKFDEITTTIYQNDLELVIKFMKQNKQPNFKGKDAFLADLQLFLTAEEV